MTFSSSQHHSFDVNLATQLGSIELAILVHHFQFWINHNKKSGKNKIEGRTWTYQTREDIAAHFPYWNSDKVKRLLDKLVKLKVIKKGNFNKLVMDRTCWYSFENEKMFTMDENVQSMDENAKWTDENVQAIPDSKPESKPTYIKDHGLEETSVHFASKKKTSVKRDIPIQKRWKLTDQQFADFQYLLLDLNLPADEATICYWVKTYSLKRIKEVYEEALSYNPDSIAAYMNKIFKKNSAVKTLNVKNNKEFAEEFIKSNKRKDVKIFKLYMKFNVDGSEYELPFDMDSATFVRTLCDKFEVNN